MDDEAPNAPPQLNATLTKTVISGKRARHHLFLTGILAILCLLGVFFPSSAEFFALIPANTAMVKFRFWNLLTAAYFENSLFMGVLNTAVALLVGRMLERKWGVEFLKLMVAVNLTTMIIVFIIMIGCYATTMSDTFLFSPICGFSAANAAFGVALKQLAPNQKCVASIEQVKFKDIPIIVIGCSLGCYMIGLTEFKDLLLVMFGTYFGWLYLRYFMSYPGSSIKGDNSEEFAFKTLFPGYTRPFGALLGNISFALCEMCGFCKVVDTPDVEMGVTNVKPSVSIPDVPQATSEAERQMAERRRQLAFKAINERLEQLKKQQASKKAAASTKEGTQKIAVADPKTKAAKD